MKKIIFHPIAALFFTIMTIIFVISLQKTREKSEQVAVTADQLKTQVSQLRLELEQTGNSLDGDNLNLEREKIIRDELLKKKEGETVFQLPPIEPFGEVVIGQVETIKPIDAWKQLIFE